MGVVTVRLNDNVSGFVNTLSKEKQKSKSEVVRELISKALQDEKVTYWLGKYRRREVTLRKVAKELNMPLWNVIDLVGENQSYGMADFGRDLKSIGG